MIRAELKENWQPEDQHGLPYPWDNNDHVVTPLNNLLDRIEVIARERADWSKIDTITQDESEPV